MTAPKVSVLVVTFNAREHALACLASVAAHAAVAHEVLVVDNASADGTPRAVRERFPGATVIANDANVGFSRANNQGLRAARGELVLVLNGDAEVRPGAVGALVAAVEAASDVGIAGPRTRYPDGRIQLSFGPRPAPLAEWRQRGLVHGVRDGKPEALARVEALAAREHEPAWVSGSCFLARRAALEAVGGFDEGFFLYQEDVDLCLRLRQAGWRIVFTPRAEVVHHVGASVATAAARASLEHHRSHLRLYRKHAGTPARALLRASLLARGGLAWGRALVSGGASERADAAALVRLAASRP